MDLRNTGCLIRKGQPTGDHAGFEPNMTGIKSVGDKLLYSCCQTTRKSCNAGRVRTWTSSALSTYNRSALQEIPNVVTYDPPCSAQFRTDLGESGHGMYEVGHGLYWNEPTISRTSYWNGSQHKVTTMVYMSYSSCSSCSCAVGLTLEDRHQGILLPLTTIE